MSTEWTRACPICNEPYKMYAFSAADQSACPDCIQRAEDRRKKQYEQKIERSVETLSRYTKTKADVDAEELASFDAAEASAINGGGL